MKFSFRQILASAIGAVLAALIASSFGVTGTIIGVAIGSMVATIGTALVSQSLERGHEAVKQVVVRVPEGTGTTLLRRLGATGAAGGTESAPDDAPTEVVGTAGDEPTVVESPAAPASASEAVDITAVVGAPPAERLDATAVAVPAVAGGAASDGVAGATGGTRTGVQVGNRRYSWKAVAATAAVVFVLALLLVTAVELIAGKPLSSIFGNAGNGPTLTHIFNPSPPATSTTTTTSTTTPPTTTTSTTGGSTTTTSSTTTTTSPTTTTTNAGATTTTTPRASNTTTTSSTP